MAVFIIEEAARLLSVRRRIGRFADFLYFAQPYGVFQRHPELVQLADFAQSAIDRFGDMSTGFLRRGASLSVMAESKLLDVE